MKLGILLCDHVRDELQAEFGDYPQMFSDLLAKSEQELSLEYFDVINGDFPQSLDDCDAYLCSGSRFSVYDNLPWITQLSDFIRSLYKAEKPFVGICFGHQLIAQALDGEVCKSPKGWGVGVAKSDLVSKQPWMEGADGELRLVVSHQDQVERLPTNTTVLASSEFCPYSMIQVGDHFLGMQGHPEFSKHYSHGLMQAREQEIGIQTVSEGMTSLKLDVHDKLLAKWIIAFIELANVNQ